MGLWDPCYIVVIDEVFSPSLLCLVYAFTLVCVGEIGG